MCFEPEAFFCLTKPHAASFVGFYSRLWMENLHKFAKKIFQCPQSEIQPSEKSWKISFSGSEMNVPLVNMLQFIQQTYLKMLQGSADWSAGLHWRKEAIIWSVLCRLSRCNQEQVVSSMKRVRMLAGRSSTTAPLTLRTPGLGCAPNWDQPRLPEKSARPGEQGQLNRPPRRSHQSRHR